jgi:hypothetical protein
MGSAFGPFPLTWGVAVHTILANIKPFLVSEITELIELYHDTVKDASGNDVAGAPPVDLVRPRVTLPGWTVQLMGAYRAFITSSTRSKAMGN